jgi:RNA polymerase sigma-70 factor, ECF subfamily
VIVMPRLLNPSLASVAAIAHAPTLPGQVQRHLGHLLAAVYAQDSVEPSTQDGFIDVLTRLDCALMQTRNDREAAFQANLLNALPALHRHAVSLSRRRLGDEDLVQSTLLRAWRFRAHFAPGTNLEAWLATIMRHQFYDNYRKRSREVGDADGTQANRMTSLPEQGGHMDLSDVRAALDRLAPPRRQALVLVAIENLTYEQAAVLIRCQVGTVKSRVSRAREQLAQTLGYTRAEIVSDSIMLAAARSTGCEQIYLP